VILGGIAASMLAQLLFGLAGSITVLLLSRLAQGASGGIVGVIQAYVTDRTDAEEGAKALGWLTTATSAGGMIGPALGALAVRWSPQAPGLLAAGLCALNLLFAWRWLRDDAPAAPVTGAPELDALAEVPAPAPVSTPATPPVRQPIWQALLDVLRRPAAPVPSL